MKKRICLFVGIALLMCQTAIAYELATHARISEQAYNRSVLATDDSLLTDFGLSELVDLPKPLGEYYFDVSGTEIITRSAQNFSIERNRMPNFETEAFTFKGWLMRGAIREDDCSIPFFCDNPGDDPTGAPRPFNHFFDPVNNEKLWLGEYTAPSWTLGTLNAFPLDGETIQPLPTNLIKTNHFTMFDAREAQYRALTGHTKAGTKDIYPTDGTPQPTEPVARAAYWATVFRIVGDMVHLLQDMGQPQHTRLDTHSKADRLDRPVYEAYINSRAIGKPYKCFGDSAPRPMPGLNYSLPNGQAYPVPEFGKYGDFFSTIQTTGRNVLTGKGLADYSNRGFFTAGTNIGSGTSYAYPNAGGITAIEEDYLDDCLQQYPAKFTLLKGTVTDQQVTTETVNNVPLSAKALWDLPNIDIDIDIDIDYPGNTLPKYTLVKKNYDAMAELLLPRAVSYSAGFINYFFRPRIALIRDISNPDYYRIRNYHKTETMDGKFELFYEDDGTRVTEEVNCA